MSNDNVEMKLSFPSDWIVENEKPITDDSVIQMAPEEVEIIKLGKPQPPSNEIPSDYAEFLKDEPVESKPSHFIPSPKRSEEEQQQYEDMVNDKETNLLKIQAYLDKFPFLKGENGVRLPRRGRIRDLPPDEIYDILYECKVKVQQRNQGTFTSNVANMGFYGVETIACKFTPVRLQGFALACQSNETIQDTIAEIQIKHMGKFKLIEPEYRLMMAVLYCGANIHLQNVGREELEQELERPLPNDFTNKYRDI